jgi:putative protein kinase ArgK-like GTPase of G3E family
VNPLVTQRKQPPLDQRLQALAVAVQLGEGRLDPTALAQGRDVLTRSGERLLLSGEHTVVALAGATGSGKSSLFNALAGLDLSAVGVRRPTTGEPLACVWGPDGAGPLLDWLDIPRRHQIQRESVLDAETQADLQGLVLLDLPDHDSTTAAHREEVDRLVRMADLFVWVLDPQKYADAAIHERYLRPLSGHVGVTIVVLNHADRLSAEDSERIRADLDRLLEEDGFVGVDVLLTSAKTGEGIADLRRLLIKQVQAKRAAGERLAADIDRASASLSADCGDIKAPEVPKRDRVALIHALANSAGVPVVGQAVEKSHRYRAVVSTGWPVTRWVRRFRPDPLRRLHLERAARTSLPAPTPVQRSQVQAALRRVADAGSRGLPATWVEAVRRASLSRAADLADALDTAVGRTDLGVSREPRWWRLVGWLQWLLVGCAAAGALWLMALFVVSWLRLPDPPMAEVEGVPLPTLLLLGGIGVGLLVAGLSRIPAAIGGKRRRRRAEAKLRASVTHVAEVYVLRPVEQEVARYHDVCSALRVAAGETR